MTYATSAPTAVLIHEYPLRMAATKRACTEVGVEVVAVTAAAETALALVDQHQPRLLILGLDSARVRGAALELLRNAREAFPEVKIVALSSEPDRGHVDAALAVGADAYVVESPERGVLRAAVGQAVQWALTDNARVALQPVA